MNNNFVSTVGQMSFCETLLMVIRTGSVREREARIERRRYFQRLENR